jgi:predicted Zn-dependent peptidase
MTTRKRVDRPNIHYVAGYRIILQPTPNPVINVECAINAGFINETKETSGVNHLLEHILTDGWKKCGSTCSGFWTDKGVDMNASTDETLLRYHTRGTLTFIDSMVAYITSIATHPVFQLKVLKKEKEAVIDEMATYGSDPESKLDQLFNEHFYTGGLVYKDDWKLQIKNLQHLDLETVKRVFRENYNPRNLLFIVTGKFNSHHVLHVFERELAKKPLGTVYAPSSCFTLNHGIYFSKEESPTTTIAIGFPSNVSAHDKDSVHFNTLCGVLNDLLFEKLRTELTLVYGVQFSYTMNICGTVVLCSIHVREKHVVECLKALFATLRHYMKALFPSKTLFAARERELFNYNNHLPYTKDYLLQFMHQLNEEKPLIYSRAERVRMVSQVKATTLQRLFQRACVIDHAMVVYQGKRDLKLDWKHIL